MHVRSYALTDIGKRRAENEDRYLNDFNQLLFGVADGIGGEDNGGEAAEAAVTAITKSSIVSRESPEVWLNELVKRAQMEALNYAPGATTLLLGHIRGSKLYIAYLGDSRCYLLRNRKLIQLTQDHAVENDPSIDKDDRIFKTNPHLLKQLTRWIGNKGKVNPEFITEELHINDRILFCTDGISNMVPDHVIEQIMSTYPEPEVMSNTLIGEALKRGGLDNATAVCVIIDSL
jgi:PPM family protein phosphatase